LQKIHLLEHLLFAAYLILFAWLVTKVKFFKQSGLTSAQLIIFFFLKVLAGIFYGWIGVYYGELAQMVDTWAYHYESLKEHQLLLDDPSYFFSSLFKTTYDTGYSGFFTSGNSWWTDLKSNSLLKVLALFNLFSFGNYYINLVFFSFVTLFGPIAIYRVMKDIFPTKKIVVLAATFLVPSFLYWTSGIHKDGIIFLGFAMVIYHFYFLIKENKLQWHRLLMIVLGVLLILALRNFLIIVFLPALTAWIISAKRNVSPWLSFVVVYVFFIVLFFTGKYAHPALDLPSAVTAKQQAFIGLTGGSVVEVNPLMPNFSGFVANAPQAFALAVIRPYPTDVRHLLSLAAAIEINFLILLFFAFLIWRDRSTSINPFLFFCVFLSFSVLIMIGYTVNFLGAIVRYRSIVLPFLIVPMVARIDWSRVKSLTLDKLK
jgi:hypothetical protein